MRAYTCPHCKQELESSEDLSGQEVECPGCERLFTIPARTAKPELPRKPAGHPDPNHWKNKPKPDKPSINGVVCILVFFGVLGLLGSGMQILEGTELGVMAGYFGFLFSILLFGFAEIVNNTYKTAYYTRRILEVGKADFYAGMAGK
ncbi:MAG: hypothetical protein RRC34_08580 [Lentisphaeria bacterium]|nr:hypothetical protein [Lentisphaeria bacterium]